LVGKAGNTDDNDDNNNNNNNNNMVGFWWGNLRERDHWGDPGVGGRIILRWTFRKWDGVVGIGWS
jgi:hypothetical protein